MSGTSEIGAMYRQLLEARGVPANGENMQRLVAESRRTPGLIPGLTVQGEDPPNQSAASMPTQPGVPNSGVALPIPPVPTQPLPAPSQVSEQSNPTTQVPPRPPPMQVSEQSNPVTQLPRQQTPLPMNMGPDPELHARVPQVPPQEVPAEVTGQSVNAIPARRSADGSIASDILAALANREQYLGPPASSMTVGGPGDRFLPALMDTLKHPFSGGSLGVGQAQGALNAMPPPNEPITPSVGEDGKMKLSAASDKPADTSNRVSPLHYRKKTEKK